jgi:DNA-binding transcriptional ArsR family regulator
MRDRGNAEHHWHFMEWKKVARITKGFANERRLEILNLLKKRPELSVEEIAETLDANIKTVSEHTRRLVLAGLLMKRYEGRYVRHKVTSRGIHILTFLRILE